MTVTATTAELPPTVTVTSVVPGVRAVNRPPLPAVPTAGSLLAKATGQSSAGKKRKGIGSAAPCSSSRLSGAVIRMPAGLKSSIRDTGRPLCLAIVSTGEYSRHQTVTSLP